MSSREMLEAAGRAFRLPPRTVLAGEARVLLLALPVEDGETQKSFQNKPPIKKTRNVFLCLKIRHLMGSLASLIRGNKMNKNNVDNVNALFFYIIKAFMPTTAAALVFHVNIFYPCFPNVGVHFDLDETKLFFVGFITLHRAGRGRRVFDSSQRGNYLHCCPLRRCRSAWCWHCGPPGPSAGLCFGCGSWSLVWRWWSAPARWSTGLPSGRPGPPRLLGSEPLWRQETKM